VTASQPLPPIRADGDDARAEAIELLRAGRIVAIPTDTVYGIAAWLDLPDAIDRLFAAKRRPPEKAVAVLLANVDQAWTLGTETPAARVLGERVPDHDAPRALAQALGPLPTTSANVSGEADARDAQEIAERLREALALVLDGGPIRGGPASTVVDCSVDRPVIRRAGAIPPDDVAVALEAAGIAHAVVR
jgi:tRNA A37 threonylcarbamoyladenosine synthetase subunit TsaC/SUA5/YrdC